VGEAPAQKDVTPPTGERDAALIAELELALDAARLQQALLRESLTTAVRFLDRNSGA
jgi:hypothetical protein